MIRMFLFSGAAFTIVLVIGVCSLTRISHASPFAPNPSPGPEIQGYTVRLDPLGSVLGVGTSVAVGDRIGFAISAKHPQDWAPAIMDSKGNLIAQLPQIHIGPKPTVTQTPWTDGSGYPVAATWSVPDDTPSGVYFVKGAPQLFFAVRERTPTSAPIVILLPTNTVNAYSTTQGRSLYPLPIQVTVASFLRPQSNVPNEGWRPFLNWLADQKPFDAPVAYITDVDMEDPSWLAHAKVLIVLGHSEYWTRAARQNFDAFIARGGDAVLAGGNVMWWQTRYSEDHRQQLQFRMLADKPVSEGGDPTTDPLLKTKLWGSPELKYSTIASIGGDYSHGGWNAKSPTPDPYDAAFVVAAPGSPLLAGTDLKMCDLISTPFGTEYDGAPIVGLDSTGRPVPDLKRIGAFRFQLIAFKWNYFKVMKLGTVHIMQAKPSSGYVLHLSENQCCITPAFYKDATHGSPLVQAIIRNAVRLFLSNSDPFEADLSPAPVVFPMTTPWQKPMPKVPIGPCAPHVEVNEPGGPVDPY